MNVFYSDLVSLPRSSHYLKNVTFSAVIQLWIYVVYVAHAPATYTNGNDLLQQVMLSIR